MHSILVAIVVARAKTYGETLCVEALFSGWFVRSSGEMLPFSQGRPRQWLQLPEIWLGIPYILSNMLCVWGGGG